MKKAGKITNFFSNIPRPTQSKTSDEDSPKPSTSGITAVKRSSTAFQSKLPKPVRKDCSQPVTSSSEEASPERPHVAKKDKGKQLQEKVQTFSLPQSPVRKKSKTVAEINKDYDATKRVRNFQPSWKKEHTWLEYDEGEMKCSICLQFPQIAEPTNPFVLGCTTLRKNTVDSHSRNRRHMRCMEAYRNAKKPGQAPMEKLLTTMPPLVQEKMTKLFRTAYYVAQQGRPFTDFGNLVKLQNLNGAALGETYANDHRCKDFVGYFNEAYSDRLKNLIEDSSYISLLCDGSTDSGMFD